MEISDEAEKQIEKMALKNTEKLMEMALDHYKETIKGARMAMDVQTGLSIRAISQQLDALDQKPPQIPE